MSEDFKNINDIERYSEFIARKLREELEEFLEDYYYENEVG